MTQIDNHQVQENSEFCVRIWKYIFFMRFLFWFFLLNSVLRGKLTNPLIPEETGLYVGIVLIAALIIVSHLMGRPRSIAITDTLIIRRYLMPDYVLHVPAQVYLEDSAVLIGRVSLELNDIQRSSQLIRWLTARAEESKLNILPLGSDRPKVSARLGYHRIWPYVPLTVCAMYAILSGALELQLLPYGWDYVFVPLIVFLLWYLVNWWLDKRAIENPMA